MTTSIEIKVHDKGLLNEWKRVMPYKDYGSAEEEWVKADYFPPRKATPGSAAFDLRACIDEPLELHMGQTEGVSCGVSIHIKDEGICGILAPRSGLANLDGIILGNSFGIIDSDYQGELMVYLHRQIRRDGKDRALESSKVPEPAVIKPYQRIAQLLFVTLPRDVVFSQVKEFTEDTERSTGGFGSTGRD